jgi:hypothetical protein
LRIDKQLLIDKIIELKEYKNVSYRQMSIESGVHNISRIVSGEIKTPTTDSWWSLHNAFPNDIPEPVYVDGGKVYKNVVSGGVSGGTINQNNTDTLTTHNYEGRDDTQLTPEELTLIRLIRTKENPSNICIDLIQNVAQRD